jgi:hypothetical protein
MVRLGSSDHFCRRYPDHPFTKGVRQILTSLVG